jgi:nitrogenase molybdenum-iron protein beta chain
MRAIPRVIPIIHASPGCGYNVYTAVNAGSGYLGGGYCGGAGWSSSNVIENEIVFGGEERLYEQIISTLELLDGDLYVVISGCMVEMIGDDLFSVVQSLPKSDTDIIALPTPSFKGNSYDGYDIIVKGLLEHFSQKNEKKEKGLVNLLGVVPGQDIFYKGNLTEIKRLLEKLGLRVNSFFGDNEDLSSFKRAAKAELTILLSDFPGKVPAEFLEKEKGVPFLSLPLPIGATGTGDLLRKVGNTLSIPKDRVNNLINSEERRYYDYLERAADIYNDIDLQWYAVIVSDANYAPSVTHFLSKELGFIPVLTVVTDHLTEEGKNIVLNRFFNDFNEDKSKESGNNLKKNEKLKKEKEKSASLDKAIIKSKNKGKEVSLSITKDKEEQNSTVQDTNLDNKTTVTEEKWPFLRFGTKASEVKRFLKEAWPTQSNDRYFETLSPGIVLGSVYERELAEDYSLPLVTLSFPATNRVIFQEARVGYNGGLTLASEILTTLVSGR